MTAVLAMSLLAGCSDRNAQQHGSPESILGARSAFELAPQPGGDCSELCKQQCAGGRSSGDCVAACEELNCNGPYLKTTPICNYLDRGIADHRRFVEDRYFVFQPGVTKLSDIDTLRFGLDLPGSYCQDNPHGTPCADASHDLEWWINSVRLSVLGMPFFEAEVAEGEQVLFKAQGGTKQAGIVGFDHDELRQHPSWGLSFNEIRSLFSDLVLDDTKQIAFDPKSIEFDSDQVARLLEGLVGRTLAADHKGCVNDLYCSDKRDRLAYWSDNPDCDFGACPATTARLPSPWLEIRGSRDGKLLRVDVDLDLLNGKTDVGDCDGVGGGIGADDCGTKYTDEGRFSLEIDLEFQCIQSGQDKFSITAGPRDVRVVTEQGVINWLFPEIWERKIGEKFDESVLVNELAKNLDACPIGPPVLVAPNGALTVVLSNTMQCDEGAACIGRRMLTGGGSFKASAAPSRIVPAARAAAISPWFFGNYTGTQILDAMEAYHGVAFSSIPATAVHLGADLMGVELDPDAKIPMATLDAAVPMLCSMASSCSPHLQFSDITIPPPFDSTASPLDCPDPEANPDSEACQAYVQMRAFVQQPAILDACIVPVLDRICEFASEAYCDPSYVEPDKYDKAIAMWLVEVQLGLDQCKENTKPIEEYIPVPFVELEIRTGRLDATDGFSFVDLQKAENVDSGDLEEFGCRHRPDQALIPDPYEYPNCTGNPGDLGCACKDIALFSAEDAASDGGFPDGAGSYLAHGLVGTGQFCDDASALGSGPVVCARIEQNGGSFPVCTECGVGTRVGCPCVVNADCTGVEPDLACFGSSADQGWAANAGGTCLPDPDVGNNKEKLSEMPWFCLDNCDAIDHHDNGVTACVFNQLPNLSFAHGTCVDFMASCKVDDVTMPGLCEEQGKHCFIADSENQCLPECETHADCPALGFPDWYACDMDGTPKCVPTFCAGDGLTPPADYCSLF
jgi:hypothetical protein